MNKMALILAGEEGFEPAPAVPVKRCTRCGETKPLDEFNHRSDSSDGHFAACKNCLRKYRRQYHETHRDKENRYRRQYHETHRDRENRYSRDTNLQRKILLIAHYSNNTNKCACCGEPDIRFLTIDHINGNGSKHRKSIGCRSGATFYRWLIKEGMPEGYQILCFNCNIARAWYGIYPHKAVRVNNIEES